MKKILALLLAALLALGATACGGGGDTDGDTETLTIKVEASPAPHAEILEKVYTDDKYGITIEINHGDGLTSTYSNLSTDSMTEVSDVVTKGQVISGVGDTSLFESLEENHLHFEIRKDGVPQDPKAYITFN